MISAIWDHSFLNEHYINWHRHYVDQPLVDLEVSSTCHFLDLRPWKTKMNTWKNQPSMKMHFLWKVVIFQFVILFCFLEGWGKSIWNMKSRQIHWGQKRASERASEMSSALFTTKKHGDACRNRLQKPIPTGPMWMVCLPLPIHSSDTNQPFM